MALEIAEYRTRSVFDQIRLTQAFRELLSFATAQATADDLVSIVREDGALLSFIADSGACFRSALAIRKATLIQDRYRDLLLRIGITLGEVEIAADEFGYAYISGEGRQDAERVMRKGPPREISVARPFFELLSRTAPDLAELLQYHGVFCDTLGPPLWLYRLDPQFRAGPQTVLDSVAATIFSPASDSCEPPGSAVQTVHAHSTLTRGNWCPRSWPRHALVTVLTAGAVVTLLHAFREEPLGLKRAEQTATVRSANRVAGTVALPIAPALQHETTHASAPPSKLIADAPQVRASAPSARSTPRSRATSAARRVEETPSTVVHYVTKPQEQPKPQRRAGTYLPTKTELSSRAMEPGTVFLAVKPWGEVYVDGRKIGVTPPLQSFDVSPGRRVITIKNSSLPIYRRSLTVKPDAKMTVAHDFGCASSQGNSCLARFGRDSSYVRPSDWTRPKRLDEDQIAYRLSGR
jgi:hypothetical protein